MDLLSETPPSTEEIHATESQMILARSKLWTPELDKLLRKWKRQIDTRRKAHYEIARNLSQRHYIIGIPSVIITTITTTGIFATFQAPQSSMQHSALSSFDISVCTAICNITNSSTFPPTPSVASAPGYEQWVRLGIGILGVAGLTLTGILTFMNYQSDAESHKTAADSYDSLYGTIESLLAIPGIVRGDPVTTLQNIRHQYDDIVKKCPNIPKEYQSELSYTTVDNSVTSSSIFGHIRTSKFILPKLNPEDITPQRDENSARSGTNLLRKIVSEDIPSFRKHKTNDSRTSSPRDNDSLPEWVKNDLGTILTHRNDFDSDDEREICLGFDLDQMVAINNTSTAIANLKSNTCAQSYSNRGSTRNLISNRNIPRGSSSHTPETVTPLNVSKNGFEKSDDVVIQMGEVQNKESL